MCDLQKRIESALKPQEHNQNWKNNYINYSKVSISRAYTYEINKRPPTSNNRSMEVEKRHASYRLTAADVLEFLHWSHNRGILDYRRQCYPTPIPPSITVDNSDTHSYSSTTPNNKGNTKTAVTALQWAKVVISQTLVTTNLLKQRQQYSEWVVLYASPDKFFSFFGGGGERTKNKRSKPDKSRHKVTSTTGRILKWYQKTDVNT